MDLSVRERPLTDAMRREAEMRAGMRCHGCGERFERGFEFVIFKALTQQGRTLVEERNTFACARGEGECGYFVRMAKEAVAMKVIGWTFLDTEKAQEVLRRDGEADGPETG